MLVVTVAVAGRAGQKDDLFSILELRTFHLDVLELDHHWRAGVQLQRQNTGHITLGFVVVDDLSGDLAVDFQNDLVAVGDDMIFVPVILFDIVHQGISIAERAFGHLAVGADYGFLPSLSEHSAASFVIERPCVSAGQVDIRLVAYGVAGRLDPAANLYAGVGRRRAAYAVFQFQLEIVYIAKLPGEELIALDRILFGGASGDCPVLHGPVAHLSSFPSVERTAVKDRLEASLLSNGIRCYKPRKNKQNNTD